MAIFFLSIENFIKYDFDFLECIINHLLLLFVPTYFSSFLTYQDFTLDHFIGISWPLISQPEIIKKN